MILWKRFIMEIVSTTDFEEQSFSISHITACVITLGSKVEYLSCSCTVITSRQVLQQIAVTAQCGLVMATDSSKTLCHCIQLCTYTTQGG